MTLSNEEQYLLELINRARLDPAAEAARYGIDLNAGLAAGTLPGGSRQVLVANAQLEFAAIGHSQWMLMADVFSHTGANGSAPWDRATAAGYTWTGIGENIAWWGTSAPTFDLQAAIESHHSGLFRSAGHRVNLLNDGFTEIGIARETGQFTAYGTDWNASMLTELFGSAATGPFLTGVVYDDRNGDGFYSIGEGVAGISFVTPDARCKSTASGGYGMELGTGIERVAGFVTPEQYYCVWVDMSAGNVKLDIVNGDTFLTSGNLTLGVGITNATALGTDGIWINGTTASNVITGNSAGNFLRGYAGADVLSGMNGNDVLIGDVGDDVLHGGQGHDRIQGNSDNDLMFGGAGNDLLNGGIGNDTMTGDDGADRFVFDNRFANDTVTDFSRAQGDRLSLDDALWGHAAISTALVVQIFAEVTTQGVVFDFGGGDVLLLAGLTSTAGLDAGIDII
ncbi:MAG: CAP domain-containing protein [Paracoccaceae bacterium]